MGFHGLKDLFAQQENRRGRDEKRVSLHEPLKSKKKKKSSPRHRFFFFTTGRKEKE